MRSRKHDQSPSTRRAWIEIRRLIRLDPRRVVALHPEGVDRNGPIGVGVGEKSDGRPPPGGRG